MEGECRGRAIALLLFCWQSWRFAATKKSKDKKLLQKIGIYGKLTKN